MSDKTTVEMAAEEFIITRFDFSLVNDKAKEFFFQDGRALFIAGSNWQREQGSEGFEEFWYDFCFGGEESRSDVNTLPVVYAEEAYKSATLAAEKRHQADRIQWREQRGIDATSIFKEREEMLKDLEWCLKVVEDSHFKGEERFEKGRDLKAKYFPKKEG